MSIIIDILTGTMKLRDAWPKINSNFTGIKTEVDAIVTGSANAEVGQAHVSTVKSKTFTTLDDRLEEDEQDLVSYTAETTTELTLKANTADVDIQISAIASGSPKATYATLAALQAAIPSGDTDIYLVVADGHWYYWSGSAWVSGGVYQSSGIAKGSVFPDDTSFIKVSSNLFNKLKKISGYVISTSTGALVVSPTFFTTDWIRATPSQQFTVTKFDRMASYDNNKNFISCPTSDATTVPVTHIAPINTAWVRFSTALTYVDIAQINEGAAALPFEGFYEKLDGIIITPDSTDFAVRGIKSFDGTFSTNLVSSSNTEVVSIVMADLFSVVFPIEEDQVYTFTKSNGGNRFILMLLPEDPRTGTLPMEALYVYRGADNIATEQEHTFLNKYGAKFLFVVTNYGYAAKPTIGISDGVNIQELSYSLNSVGLKHLSSDVASMLNTPKTYYFVPESIVGAYTAKTGTYTQLLTVPDVHNAYDALAVAYPNYVTKTLLGNDSSGTYPIYQYTLKPQGAESILAKKLPKILTHALIHGEEKPSIYALYYMVKAICEDWKTDALLEYLRWNVEIILIPIVNVYGYANNQRFNFNNVNLQKNADWNWELSDPDSGSAPFSEVETQYIKTMLDANTDAILYTDIHAASEGYDLAIQVLPYLGLYSENLEIASKYTIEKMTREFQRNYGIEDTFVSRLNDNKIGWIHRVNVPGATYMYSIAQGVSSMSLEVFYRLPSDSTNYSSDAIKATSEYLTNWIFAAIKRYKDIY